MSGYPFKKCAVCDAEIKLSGQDKETYAQIYEHTCAHTTIEYQKALMTLQDDIQGMHEDLAGESI